MCKIIKEKEQDAENIPILPANETRIRCHEWKIPHCETLSYVEKLLKMLYQITFRLCVQGTHETEITCTFRLGSQLQDSS
jgi:hypothetical protein